MDLGFKLPVPGAWRVPTDIKLDEQVSNLGVTKVMPNLAFLVENALTPSDCAILMALFANQNKSPVSVSGYATADVNQIGSHRATGWGPELAGQLWHKMQNAIKYALSGHRVMKHNTPTDWYGIPDKRIEYKVWMPTGVSPVLRFMEYKKGGKHNTHYDMGYDYQSVNPWDKRRTLMSVVWYLNNEPDTGGCTRFIEDNQGHLPIHQRNLDDWVRESSEEEVIAAQAPKAGSALVFWHRMAHDVSEFTGNSRIIIRGDVEFTALD